MTCSAIKDSMARFRANPWSAQTAPALTATLAEHGGRLTGGPFTWNVGLPPVVGAGNEGPSPTLYLLGALAGSAVALIHDTLAPQLGVRVAGVAATARCRSDLRSLLGMDGADPRLTGLARSRSTRRTGRRESSCCGGVGYSVAGLLGTAQPASRRGTWTEQDREQ